MSIIGIVHKLRDFPKTVYFNFKAFPFETAVKLPVRVAFDTKIDYIRKGCIVLEGNVYRGMISIGKSNVKGVVGERRTHIRFGLHPDSRVIFKGNANFAKGALLAADRGTLIFGSDFSASNNLYISCNERIEFGEQVLIGWGVNIRDSNNHTVFYDGKEATGSGTIKVGNHVWIASYADILKGAEVCDDSVVAYRALVTKKFSESNILIGGVPAQKIKENVNWSR